MSPDDLELSELIRQRATRHAAPDALRAAVRARVALVEAGRVPVAMPARRRWLAFGWRTASAGFLLGVACALLVPPLAQRLSSDLSDDLIADHVRSLRAGPLADVLSSDRHTVKPWFQGRLDYAPPVFDLAAEGYPLVGGRVEHLRGNPVATLAYTHNRHVINLFVWPDAAQRAPARSLRRGFKLLNWADGAMQYWAVSDMDSAEIERFVQLWQQRAAAQ